MPPQERSADWTAPRVHVLHDQWTVNGRVYELQITAWDQLGMVPMRVADAGLPLRLSVPESALHAVDEIHLPDANESPLGLDLFNRQNDPQMRIFPNAPGKEPTVFGDSAHDNKTHANATGHKTQGHTTALGAVLATHNVSPGRLNIHTAPINLLEAAMREAGRGGLETIIAAREQGEQVSLGTLPEFNDPNDQAPQLVAHSDTWAFRIDARIGASQKSWWSVYQPIDQSWECVQRLVVRE